MGRSTDITKNYHLHQVFKIAKEHWFGNMVFTIQTGLADPGPTHCNKGIILFKEFLKIYIFCRGGGGG